MGSNMATTHLNEFNSVMLPASFAAVPALAASDKRFSVVDAAAGFCISNMMPGAVAA